MKDKNNMAEKDKGCQVAKEEGVCGRELYDEEHCIFHSRKIDKDAKSFQEKLNEIFKDKSLERYDFSNFIFPEGILFPDTIAKKVTFFQAVFQGETDLGYKTFQDEVWFHRTNFQGNATFDYATFQKQIHFFKTIFEHHASFENTSFDIAYFDGIKFNGMTSFDFASFKNRTVFEDITFEKDASFSGAIFNGVTELFAIASQNIVSFSGATFEDEVVIFNRGKNEFFSEKEVDFRYVGFSKPERVIFMKIDLSKFRFLGTDLRKVEFVDVDWDKGKGRNKIYDEVSLEKYTEKFDYPLIAQVYKRLRASYEENLNYAEAGDFHIGEMECKRKSYKTWFGKYLSLTALYKYVSHYGESYRRPLLFWILPILLLFPILFMYSGIEGLTQNQPPYLINYNFDTSSISLNKADNWAKDYLKSFVYSLSVFSLVREKQYRPIDNWGHFWMVLESILSPVLIAFFLLALRRRFRR